MLYIRAWSRMLQALRSEMAQHLCQKLLLLQRLGMSSHPLKFGLGMQSFDELLLLKRGGRVIYFGETGHDSQDLVRYFEGLPGVPKLREGINPATWMLEISTGAQEQRLGLDFADAFADSELAGCGSKCLRSLEISSQKLSTGPILFLSAHKRPERIKTGDSASPAIG